MMVPGLVYMLINNYLPMLGIVIAFKKINFTKGLLGSEWIGFENFEYLFKTSDAFIITRNTILYNLLFIVLGTALAFICAILLNEIKNKLLLKFYQSVITLPHLISMVIVSYLVYALLSPDTGFMNRTVLPWFGVEDGISWYSEEKYWPWILTIVHFWKGVGYSSIIFFAALLGIDEEYYEAARLDGASRVKQILHITLPILTPVITMLTLLSIGRIFYSDFGLFYQVPMNSGALFNTTATIDTYVFRGLMGSGDIGMSTAAGVYQSIVGFLLVIIANYVVRKASKDNALF
ncbi:ABC transporter permease subunit [Paenibacillus sp. N4]|nr:ABC transporter permease subunit [Paenibacillus vietnamensis]